MIKKERFVEILDKMRRAKDIKADINNIFKNSGLVDLEDFADSTSLVICFDDFVIELLEDMFDTDMISYWVYELNFGANYFDGCVLDKNGVIIDIKTSEKLYNYLLEDLKNASKI